MFSKIANQISKLPMGEGVCIFVILCSQQNAAKPLGTINMCMHIICTWIYVYYQIGMRRLQLATAFSTTAEVTHSEELIMIYHSLVYT